MKTGKVRILAITGAEADTFSLNGDDVDFYRVWNGKNPIYPFSLFRLISSLRPDIVHVQFGPDRAIYGGLFGEPMLLLLLLLRAARIRTTVTLHSTWMPEQVREKIGRYSGLGRISVLAAPLFQLYMRLLDWGTDALQLSTVREKSNLRRRFLYHYSFTSNKVLEIPHPCIKPTRKQDAKKAIENLGLSGRSLILAFGFIRCGKGLEIAIRSLERVRHVIPEAFLVIAGRPLDNDGRKYLKELIELTRRLSLGNHVRFDTRYIPEDVVVSYFSAATAVLIPYAESVGASGPMHNYAGYGVPFVVSDTGYHIKEALGGNAILFRTGDPNDLADKLVNVLDNNELVKRISCEQLEYARLESWDMAVKRTLQNYQRVIFGA